MFFCLVYFSFSLAGSTRFPYAVANNVYSHLSLTNAQTMCMLEK